MKFSIGCSSFFIKLLCVLSKGNTYCKVSCKLLDYWLQCVFYFFFIYLFFFNCYLAVPRPTLGHSQGDSLTNPMLITAYVRIRPKGQQEPRSEVGSLSLVDLLAGFEPGTFQFLFQRLNPLAHSPHSLYL